MGPNERDTGREIATPAGEHGGRDDSSERFPSGIRLLAYESLPLVAELWTIDDGQALLSLAAELLMSSGGKGRKTAAGFETASNDGRRLLGERFIPEKELFRPGIAFADAAENSIALLEDASVALNRGVVLAIDLRKKEVEKAAP